MPDYRKNSGGRESSDRPTNSVATATATTAAAAALVTIAAVTVSTAFVLTFDVGGIGGAGEDVSSGRT